jgi:hypothetical protein
MHHTQLRSASFAPRTPTNYVERDVVQAGYTEPCLTAPQHTAVILGTSFAAAMLHQPIRQLGTLSFLVAVPGDKSQIVVISDKRAMLFHSIFSTQWFGSFRGVMASWLNYASLIGIYAATQPAFKERFGNGASGCIAGGIAGFAQAMIRHPFDVLRATAEHPHAPKKFSGPLDVFWTSLRHKPSNLFDLHRGGGLVVLTTTLQFSILFGWYNAVKEDRVARGLHHLFLAVHVMACATTLIAYPCLNLRQLVHIANLQIGGGVSPMTSAGGFARPRITASQLFWDMKKRHGITKVYDGFFRNRPFLAIAPLSLAITLYDLGCRRYTEFIYPSRRKVHAEVDQFLFRPTIPAYVLEREKQQREASLALAASSGPSR